MKKFEIVKMTFEAHIAVNAKIALVDVENSLQEKLTDKLEMYCTDNAFGLSDCQVTLERYKND
jgi:hypothetical protein